MKMEKRSSLYPYKIEEKASHPVSERGIDYGVRCTNRNATSSRYLDVNSSPLPECSVISIEDEARALDLEKFLLKFKGHTVGYYFVDERDSSRRKFLFPLFDDDLNSWFSKMLPGEGVAFIPWFNERFKPDALPIWSKILKSTIQMHENGLKLQKSKSLLKDGLIIIIGGEPYIIECPLELGKDDGVSVEVDIRAVLKRFIEMITLDKQSNEDALPTCVKESVQYFKTLIRDNTPASALTFREKLWDPLFLSKQDKLNFVKGIINIFSGKYKHLVSRGTKTWRHIFGSYKLSARRLVYEELIFYKQRIKFERSQPIITWVEKKKQLRAKYRGWFDVLNFTRMCLAHYAEALKLSKTAVKVGQKRKLTEVQPVDDAEVIEYLDKDFEIVKHIANFVNDILKLKFLQYGDSFAATSRQKKRLKRFMTL